MNSLVLVCYVFLKVYPKKCFQFSAHFLRITLPVHSDVLEQLEADKKAKVTTEDSGSEKGSEKKETQLTRFLSMNPDITISEIAHELEISTRMVEKYISQLKKDGKIARVGGRKTGHRIIMDDK